MPYYIKKIHMGINFWKHIDPKIIKICFKVPYPIQYKSTILKLITLISVYNLKFKLAKYFYK